MPLLSIENLVAGYGCITVLRGISLCVEQGEIVALIGANGAGKSTTLRSVSRLIPCQSGSVTFKGKNLLAMQSHDVARMGLSHVAEGRGIFGNLTVMENLQLALFANRTKKNSVQLFQRVFDLFPVLGQRQKQCAATLSGGEQQMLAIGRAMVSDGDMFILDEPSMGLSPKFVQAIFSTIAQLNKQGKAILLIEQNATMALQYAHRAYVLENGHIRASGLAKDIAANEELKRAYLG